MANETWTVARLLEWTEQFLRDKKIESPRLEAQLLLAHALGCTKIELYVRHEESPTEAHRTTFREMIKKRAEGMPVAYLIGYREFFSLAFQVSPAVLIPRPDTEVLVIETAQRMKRHAEPHVLDVGTGSGCIAIALAKQHKTARVTATDISPAALAVAQQNATKHAVHERVTFLEGDMLDPVRDQQFDFVVSNPPYITTAEMGQLEPSVRAYEPELALVAGADGLDCYRRLTAGLLKHLKPAGMVLLEVGYQQADAVRELLRGAQLELGPTFKDLGGHVRVVTAQRPHTS
jgi:release factor glutamine methyltransferase